jgi:mono/diheme cytochrome c family protein
MMKLLKIAGWLLVALLVVVAAAITFTIGWRPFVGPSARALTDRTFPSTPERLARGQYLAENVLNCFACHTERDWSKHDAPEVPGTHGAGSQSFPVTDLPGRVYPPNITPDKETGSGSWTDDQLARAIREGIGYDGRALFPMMPYENYRFLSDEDLASVIVYLRSIPPVRRDVPRTELIFPVKYLIRTAPHPVTEPVGPPDVSTPEKRGDYLLTIGGCRDCHTPQVQGQRLMQFDLAGGFPIRGPWGDVAGANITQSPSGIPYYDETLFLEVFRKGFVKARELKPIMPWWSYQGMTDDDLKSIFAYLRSVPKIQHRVDNSKPPTLCKACGLSHGAGDEN